MNPTTTEAKPLHIIALDAQNVKRLRAVNITPTGDLIVIGGNNGQGKTSVLDSIEMALAGTKCAKPIREGASKGDECSIIIEDGSVEEVRENGSHGEARANGELNGTGEGRA